MKPSNTFGVKITTDKPTYTIGDTVNYLINVIDRSTNKTVSSDDVLVSVFVTDASVFNLIDTSI